MGIASTAPAGAQLAQVLARSRLGQIPLPTCFQRTRRRIALGPVRVGAATPFENLTANVFYPLFNNIVRPAMMRVQERGSAFFRGFFSIYPKSSPRCEAPPHVTRTFDVHGCRVELTLHRARSDSSPIPSRSIVIGFYYDLAVGRPR